MPHRPPKEAKAKASIFAPTTSQCMPSSGRDDCIPCFQHRVGCTSNCKRGLRRGAFGGQKDRCNPCADPLWQVHARTLSSVQSVYDSDMGFLLFQTSKLHTFYCIYCIYDHCLYRRSPDFAAKVKGVCGYVH